MSPDDVNVIVEVPVGGEPIKYELDKESGTLVVDRFLYTAMRYPGNYGFIPHTLSGDGDPVDVLIANTRAIAPGAVISVRPVGVLLMEDNAGMDEKIVAVPSLHISQRFDGIANYKRPAGDHDPPDRAFLRPLQGSRARQMGQDRALGRCGRGQEAYHRGYRKGEKALIRDLPKTHLPCQISRMILQGASMKRVGIAAAALVLVPGLAFAGHGKAGLWNISTTMDMGGVQMPPEAMAKMKTMGVKMPSAQTFASRSA